ncbi:MAG: hypothetical protein ACE5GV_01150 [Candidatus Scalindua sp.]
MNTEHKTIEELMVYLENPIRAEEDETVEIHLAECSKCVSDLSFLDALRTGLREFGQNSRRLVENGVSVHLTNKEIPGYINDVCDKDVKRRIMTHIAGCDKCINDVLAVKSVLEQLASKAALMDKILLLSKFIISSPSRVTAIEKEGKELISEAARNCIAPFLLERTFSFAFKGEEGTKAKLYSKPRKMDIRDFTVEITQTFTKPPKVIIGIMAKEDFKQVKATIYLKEEQREEQPELLPLRQRNAVIHKENMKIDDIINIELQGYK